MGHTGTVFVCFVLSLSQEHLAELVPPNLQEGRANFDRPNFGRFVRDIPVPTPPGNALKLSGFSFFFCWEKNWQKNSMDPIIATGEADLCANTLSHEKKGPWLFYGIPGVYYYLVKIINYRDPYKNQPNISRKSSGLGAFFRGKKMGSSEFLKIPRF